MPLRPISRQGATHGLSQLRHNVPGTPGRESPSDKNARDLVDVPLAHSGNHSRASRPGRTGVQRCGHPGTVCAQRPSGSRGGLRP
eukprot:11484847-Alexandrium_andersonii.AAC.1